MTNMVAASLPTGRKEDHLGCISGAEAKGALRGLWCVLVCVVVVPSACRAKSLQAVMLRAGVNWFFPDHEISLYCNSTDNGVFAVVRG